MRARTRKSPPASQGGCAVAIGELPEDHPAEEKDREQRSKRRYRVLVTLNYEQMAAAEGWRAAHGISDQAEALGELIRLGLLSEVAKIYRLVSENRASVPRRQGRS